MVILDVTIQKKSRFALGLDMDKIIFVNKNLSAAFKIH